MPQLKKLPSNFSDKLFTARGGVESCVVRRFIAHSFHLGAHSHEKGDGSRQAARSRPPGQRVRIGPAEKNIAAGAWFWLHHCVESACMTGISPAQKGLARMARTRMHILYTGRVQGVGFRYTTKTVALGYEVTGIVRNLADGRVELTVEGERDELQSFREAVRDSGLGGLIRDEAVAWSPATSEFKGFEIVK